MRTTFTLRTFTLRTLLAVAALGFATTLTNADEAPSIDNQPFVDSAQQFLDGYAARDAAAIGELFTNDAEFLDEFGVRTVSKSAIVELFSDVFASSPVGSLDEIRMTGLRVITDRVVVEEGETVATSAAGMPPSTSKYVALHVKQSDGQWKIDLLKSFGVKDGTRAEQLSGLAWMLGDWVSEGRGTRVETSCRYSDDNNYLLRSFKVRTAGDVVMQGVQRIGWDPVQQSLRSWTFDSEGGFFDGTWSARGTDWLVTQQGVTADAEQATSTALYEVVDREMVRWQFLNRVIGTDVSGRGEVVVMVRKPPAAGE